MAWVTPATKTTGTLITAAIWNADVVANPQALRDGGIAIASQAANEIPYASSATQLTRNANFKFDGTTFTTPGQIAFPATQAASAGANTLDDYEEGTWTPVIGGAGGTSGQTYANQVGLYAKVGQLVACTFNVTLSNKGTITGNVQIEGLPFTSHASDQAGAAVLPYNNLGANHIVVTALVNAGATTARILAIAAAAADYSAITTAAIGNATTFHGTIIYRAAA